MLRSQWTTTKKHDEPRTTHQIEEYGVCISPKLVGTEVVIYVNYRIKQLLKKENFFRSTHHFHCNDYFDMFSLFFCSIDDMHFPMFTGYFCSCLLAYLTEISSTFSNYYTLISIWNLYRFPDPSFFLLLKRKISLSTTECA